MTTTIYTSEKNINIDRYSSVLYYETIDIYTSEFKDLLNNGFFDGEQNKETKTKKAINDCANDKSKPKDCKFIDDKIIEIFNNPIIDSNKDSSLNNINIETLGIDIITNIMFKRLFENSLKYLIRNKKNTLFIFPKSDIIFNQYINTNKIVGNFYKSIIKQDATLINDLSNNNNVINYINIYPENSDDTVEVYKDQLIKNINEIKELIKTNAIKPRGGAEDSQKVITNIIYLVDKDNNLFIDYYKTILQKKYIDVLNSVMDDFYSTSRINLQEFKRFSTVKKDLSTVNKAYIIKVLNTTNSVIKNKIKEKNFDNNLGILLNVFELFYQIRLDKSNKKKLSSSSNSSIFNIFLRFNNIDNPIITTEIIANKNVLYVLKSEKKNKIGYFSLVNENKKQYKFVLSAIENKYYKLDPNFKKKTTKTSENNADNAENNLIAEQLEDALLENKTSNKIDEKTTMIEIRYMYGKIQYKNIENNLYEKWNTNNTIVFYKTINTYEIYKFFNHRMIDISFKDNIDIKYFKNTIYNKKNLIEYLKSEKKYNEKTRLAYEFINININNDLLLKYNNYIYDNYKNDIDLSLEENKFFIEKIKKGICDIIFENNSLVYIKETNQVKNAPKEEASADNYKITNYKYYKINNENKEKQIQDHFINLFNERDKLKCKGTSKTCVFDISKNEIELPDELKNAIGKKDKTIALSIVNITKELDKDTTGLLFASECKGKKQTLKQSYYNLIRKIKGDNVYSGGYKKKKTKKIRSRRTYFSKYPKVY